MDLCVMSWKKAEKNKYIYIYIMNNTPNAADDIKAMGDSVDLINKMLQVSLPSSGKHTYETHDNVKRNIDHIDIMLKKDHIKNSGEDLSSFEKIVVDGNKFLSDNTFEEDNK